MNHIGMLRDPHEGRPLIERLDAEAAQKRKLQRKQALDDFVGRGIITAEQAGQCKAIIDNDTASDPHDRMTAFQKAKKAGILTQVQADALDDVITQITRGEKGRCTGIAAYLYDSGETTLENVSLKAVERDESVVKAVNGATVHINGGSIEKYGNTTDHMEGSMTGLNAAVLAEGGVINLENMTVTSRAEGGNNVYAHGKGSIVNLKNVRLDAYGTVANRCIYLSWGGKVTAENCEFTSRGFISSTVATDTGGGDIILQRCAVRNLGHNGASLYCTGNITARECMCIAPECEGLIIVGNNTLDLTDCYVLSGEGQGVKIFTREGDGGYFNMRNGLLSVCEGPVVYACGNHGHVMLKNVKIANPGNLAFVAAAGPHMMHFPGEEPQISKLVVDMYQQILQGDSSCDDTHALEINLHDGSRYAGAVNRDRKGSHVKVTLDAGSTWELTGDSFVDELKNGDSSGANIITNGYRLAVG